MVSLSLSSEKAARQTNAWVGQSDDEVAAILLIVNGRDDRYKLRKIDDGVDGMRKKVAVFDGFDRSHGGEVASV